MTSTATTYGIRLDLSTTLAGHAYLANVKGQQITEILASALLQLCVLADADPRGYKE